MARLLQSKKIKMILISILILICVIVIVIINANISNSKKINYVVNAIDENNYDLAHMYFHKITFRNETETEILNQLNRNLEMLANDTEKSKTFLDRYDSTWFYKNTPDCDFSKRVHKYFSSIRDLFYISEYLEKDQYLDAYNTAKNNADKNTKEEDIFWTNKFSSFQKNIENMEEYQNVVERKKEQDKVMAERKTEEVAGTESNRVYSGNDTGKEWRRMTNSEKNKVVNDIISTLRSKGWTFTVTASYFVSGIDSYYGDGGLDNDTIISVFSMVGIAGGVMKD